MISLAMNFQLFISECFDVVSMCEIRDGMGPLCLWQCFPLQPANLSPLKQFWFYSKIILICLGSIFPMVTDSSRPHKLLLKIAP